MEFHEINFEKSEYYSGVKMILTITRHSMDTNEKRFVIVSADEQRGFKLNPSVNQCFWNVDAKIRFTYTLFVWNAKIIFHTAIKYSQVSNQSTSINRQYLLSSPTGKPPCVVNTIEYSWTRYQVRSRIMSDF